MHIWWFGRKSKAKHKLVPVLAADGFWRNEIVGPSGKVEWLETIADAHESEEDAILAGRHMLDELGADYTVEGGRNA